MKRTIRMALTALLALAVSTAGAFAAEVDAHFNKVNIEVGGELKAVSGEFFVRERTDGTQLIMPYSILYKGTTYLPLAKVCELVGKDVSWDGETRTVYISTPRVPAEGSPASTAQPSDFQVGKIPEHFDTLNIVVCGQTFARPGMSFDRGEGEMVSYSLLYNDTTYLPLAAVCQIVGKDISFDGDSFTAIVRDQEELSLYKDTEVANFGALCGLPKAPESTEDDLMVYNHYNYNDTSRQGQEAADLQKYVGYLFDAGFTFSLEDSRKFIGEETTTLYAYRNEESGRVVVIGLIRAEGLAQVTVSYTK